jgi:hypothetical protein
VKFKTLLTPPSAERQVHLAAGSKQGVDPAARRHPGYISWEDYRSNLDRVKGNALAWSAERHRGPPREGTALLQGLVSCGERMGR